MKDKILDFLSWAILNSDDFMLLSSMFMFGILILGSFVYNLITNFIGTLWILAGILLGVVIVGIAVAVFIAFTKLKDASYFWAVRRKELIRLRGVNK